MGMRDKKNCLIIMGSNVELFFWLLNCNVINLKRIHLYILHVKLLNAKYQVGNINRNLTPDMENLISRVSHRQIRHAKGQDRFNFTSLYVQGSQREERTDKRKKGKRKREKGREREKKECCPPKASRDMNIPNRCRTIDCYSELFAYERRH